MAHPMTDKEKRKAATRLQEELTALGYKLPLQGTRVTSDYSMDKTKIEMRLSKSIDKTRENK